MRFTLTLLGLLLCACLTASAQAPDSLNYRHSLGIVASPVLDKLFTSNRELPVGLIYRLQVQSNANMRISLLASHDSENFTSSGTNYEANWSNNYFQIAGGYEWQQPLSSKWVLYYGIEGGVLAGIIKSDSPFNFPDDITKYTRKTIDKSVGVLLRPLAGLNFNLSDNIYISTETAVLIRRHRREINSDVFNSLEKAVPVEQSNGIWKKNKIKYQPFSSISISLRF